jgi:predicted DNA-binding transcriptional regulator YafY
MRADRLLSILMLLQGRGRMTARELAHELEVSERTVYRDLEALSSAGVPVVAESGPGGGCALMDDYRTSLTGLTEPETRALFMHMVSVPDALTQLGIGAELRAALLKLAAALPAARRDAEIQARQRIHLDTTPWRMRRDDAPHLQTLYEGVLNDRRLRITRRLQFGAFFATEAHEWIAPLGMVAKVNAWYCVARIDSNDPPHIRAFRASEVTVAELCDETFERPAGFDLPAWWRSWCAVTEAQHSEFIVEARIAPHLRHTLHLQFGENPPIIRWLDAQDDWPHAALVFDTLAQARSRLLALGGAVEVLAPAPLRWNMADMGRQIMERYAPAKETA